MTTKRYKDDYGNHAVIEQVMMAPYKDAKKEAAWRLKVYNNENFLYYVTVYETEKAACNMLGQLSCGTFKA